MYLGIVFLQISIVVCTSNRSASLRRLLRSLETEVSPQSKNIEIVVVANGCEDDTAEVVNSFMEQLPLRLIVESLPGLSRARNVALTDTNGEAILWLDDDTEITQGLIASYVEALEKHPDVTYFAGRISSGFEGAPPSWVRFVVKKYPSTYSLLNMGTGERALNPNLNEFPFGANMLVRRDALSGFRFNEGLGRNQNADNLVGGEETELFKKLSAEGHVGVWVPDANVVHWMPPNRQTFQYFSAYQFAAGIIGVRLLGQKTTPFFWLLLPRYILSILIGRATFWPSLWVPALTELQRERGRVAEAKAALTIVKG